MTEILLSVSPSVFSWSMLGRGSSSAAFLLPGPEKGVVCPIPRWTHPARVAVVAPMVTYLVSISRNAATGRATWRHLSSWDQHCCSTEASIVGKYFFVFITFHCRQLLLPPPALPLFWRPWSCHTITQSHTQIIRVVQTIPVFVFQTN